MKLDKDELASFAAELGDAYFSHDSHLPFDEQKALTEGKTIQPEGRVFLSPEGCRLDERNLVRSFQECAKAVRLRKIRFHDLRHIFASQLIEEGAYQKYIQEQLGHLSINATGTYGHLFPNRNRSLVD